MSVVDIIESDVRDVVRKEGIDPVVRRDIVQKYVDDAVAAYTERSLSRPLPPLEDPEAVTRTVVDAIAGYGPLQRYFDDPEIEEIWINEPGKVFVARQGRSELTTTILTEGEVQNLVERMLKSSGRRLDTSSPFVDAMLPDGSRLHVAIPDITRRHWAVNIRKHLMQAARLDDLVALGTLSDHAARFLQACVAAGLNLLVSGGVKAGKTTLLNCLVAAVPPRERIVSCEEVFEIQPRVPDIVHMQTRQASLEGTGEITLRRLIKEALRKRPDRLIVGEVRQEECFDLLIALSSGNPGMCTLHANDARSAVQKLCNLSLLAQENLNSRAITETVASSVDIVVQVNCEHDGQRRVREIVAVPGRIEGEIIELEQIFRRRSGMLTRADGFPPHVERFEAAGIDLRDVLGSHPGTR
ncbi:CpaF family protein [Actinobacteria bacterium YIM 96077]|uniref:CpaF family protein n=1 Tax=Phytoactinopolyspora halophila TaxID=1981511 RepID=A0A329R277_9ACTN|nr:ATPase, T2SS/T4P/T4SS family [Phytoactinopolyspora halophila]AYY12088.1 CpaF family protein [Actinobacteria bacterium YIM 96077]RAW18677.1 CpaF family protein [Phytoactinopolyspora halophila]